VVTGGVNGFNAIEVGARLGGGFKEGKSRQARYGFDSASSSRGAGLRGNWRRPDSMVMWSDLGDAGGAR
jgi:hypothetical protein